MAEVLQKLSVKRFTATSCNRPGTPREGMRIGEAMRLDRDDIDWDDKVLVVRSSKFGRSREVACHDSTIDALQAYSARRDRLCPRPASASFFVSQHGRRLAHHSIYPAFHQLAREAGLPQRPGGRAPNVHGLRHSFAVGTLLVHGATGPRIASWRSSKP